MRSVVVCSKAPLPQSAKLTNNVRRKMLLSVPLVTVEWLCPGFAFAALQEAKLAYFAASEASVKAMGTDASIMANEASVQYVNYGGRKEIEAMDKGAGNPRYNQLIKQLEASGRGIPSVPNSAPKSEVDAEELRRNFEANKGAGKRGAQ